MRGISMGMAARRRGVVTGLAGIVAALVLTGCIVIQSQSASQPTVIGSVRLTTTVCASGSSGCPDQGNSQSTASFSGSRQVLIGYRIPAGASAPGSFSSTSTGPSNTGSLAFTQSPSYTSELQRLAPAPSGEQWVGYTSNAFTYGGTSSGEQQFTVAPDFGLPRPADGGAFRGPFYYRTVVGYRTISGSTPATSDVQCGSSLTGSGSGGGPPPSTTCVDSPSPGELGNDLAFSSADAAIYFGAPATAAAGSTGYVPFVLQFAGPNSTGASFNLSAGSTLGPAAVNVPSVIPGSDSTNPVLVSVPVPAGTAPGTYQVALSATLPNGQTRTGAGLLKVTPPGTAPGAPPGVSCVIPDVVGQKLETVDNRLAASRCRLGQVRHRHARTVKRGRVIRQALLPGKLLPVGSPMIVVFSLGPRHHRHRR